MVEEARSSYLATSNGNIAYQIITEEVAVNEVDNTSTINIRVEAWRWDNTTTNYAGICTIWIRSSFYGDYDTISNEWAAGEKPISYYSDTVVLELSDEAAVTVEHNLDGSLDLEIWAELTYWNSGGSPIVTSEWQGYDVHLTKLPGKPQLGISCQAKSTKSIQVYLSASRPCNRWWYSLDSGETWVEFAQGIEGQSVNTIVGDLMPRRTYYVKGCGRTLDGDDIYSSIYYIKTNGVASDTSNHMAIFNPTDRDFSTNGLGSLTDAISCIVTEERNGAFELQLEYPINGINYNYLRYRYIIVANANPYDDPEPFRIYSVSKPIDGKVTVNAAHISYDLSGWSVKPFKSATYLWDTIVRMSAHVDNVANFPFSVSTDMMANSDEKDFETKFPKTVRSIIGDGDESIIAKWGCEMLFREYSVYFQSARGSDNGVVIRYSKNMTNFKLEGNSDNVYTRIRAYWYKEVKEDASWDEKKKGGLVETDPPLIIPNPNSTSYLDQYISDIENLEASAETLNTSIEDLRIYIKKYNNGELDVAATAEYLDVSEETLTEELAKYPEGSLLDLNTIVNWTEPEGYPHRTLVLDMSDEVWKEIYYDEKNEEYKERDRKPTASDLTTRLAENLMLGKYSIFSPVSSISVSFVNVYDSEEYKDHGLQDLEKIRLCDIVTVIFPNLLGEDDYTDENGMTIKMKCVKTIYNVLLKKYDSIELGMIQKDIASTISGQSTSITNASSTANHSSGSGSGGTIGSGDYVLLDYSRGPGKLMSMDTPTATGAGDVIKVDFNGVTHSSDGVNGRYETLISQSGSINANTVRTNSFDGGILKPDTVTKGDISSEYDKYINGEIQKESKNITDISKFSDSQICNIYEELHTDGVTVGKGRFVKVSGGVDFVIYN